jgi:hypothetical protein
LSFATNSKSRFGFPYHPETSARYRDQDIVALQFICLLISIVGGLLGFTGLDAAGSPPNATNSDQRLLQALMTTKTAQRWRKEAVQAVIHLQPRDFTHHRGNHNAATATI